MGVFVLDTLTRLHWECEKSLHVIVVLQVETPSEILGHKTVKEELL